MGRPHTSGAPFSSASRAHASVYLCVLTNGMVKVGFTNNPRTRLTSFHTEARRNFGEGVDRFVVFDRAGWGRGVVSTSHAEKRARLIERLSIKRLAFIGSAVAPYTELFNGVDFGCACEAVRSAISFVDAA